MILSTSISVILTIGISSILTLYITICLRCNYSTAKSAVMSNFNTNNAKMSKKSRKNTTH